MIDAAFLAALNHLLQGANWATGRLAPFAGRHARIAMPPLQLAFVVGSDGLCAASGGDAEPDVVIHLPADSPIRLLSGIDRVMAGARVEGNAEFATELSFVFRHLRWDAEEDLAHLIGDIPAHRLMQGAGRLAARQKRAAQGLAGNLAEYFIHEDRLLVSAREFAAFREDMVRLNAALDRLENRARSLAPTHKESKP